jgi:hypothetical protein
MEAGVLKTMAEQGEGDFSSDVNENLVEENWTELEPFDRGQWRVQAWEGHAEPGERLFTEGEGPRPQFETEEHALSTVYTFEMPLPRGPMMETGPAPDQPAPEEPQPEGEEGEAAEGEGAEGMQQMGAAMGEMMAMMMSTGEAGLRFSVELPGQLVVTNGQIISQQRAAWKIDLSAEEPPVTELHAVSRLPNWAVVGQLGARMAEMDRADLVPALISGVRRGVLPDPVGDVPAAELDALMYVQATEIMMALDAAVGEQIATDVMRTLGLTGDPDPATVEEIAVRLEGMDLAAEIDEGARQHALELLGGE